MSRLKLWPVSDAIKWQTFLRISLVLVVLVGSLLLIDRSMNEQQFSLHRHNIQAQYAFQLERLVESSADKMIQISGAASLNDALINALQNQQTFRVEQELESLDWHLQADAGLSVVGMFDAQGKAYHLHDVLSQHDANLAKVLRNESPLWSVDCGASCQIISYTPLLAEGVLVAVLALSEPLSHVLLRFHHVANIDTGLLTQLTASPDKGNVAENWAWYLEAVTSPKQSRAILAQAAQAYSLEELQQAPQVIDHDNRTYELKALPFNNSQLVVMTEASKDYQQLAQLKSQSAQLALIVLLIGEGLLFAFLWSPLSRIKFSETLLSMVADKRFDELKQAFDRARPQQKDMAQEALKLGDQFITMQKKITEQAQSLKALGDHLEDQQVEFPALLNGFNAPVLVLDGAFKIQQSNVFLRQQLCLSATRLVGQDITQFLSTSQGLMQRLEDVLEGGLGDYEFTAKCKDEYGNPHTYWWRVTCMASGQDALSRQLILLGLPLSKPSMDSERQWLEMHDQDTSLFNAAGLSKQIQNKLVLPAKHASEKSALVLLRLPSVLLDPSRVPRSIVLNMIKQLVFQLEKYTLAMESGTLITARLDVNELAFLVTAEQAEKLDAFVTTQGLPEAMTGSSKVDQPIHLARRNIHTSDQYASDVMFETRQAYRLISAQ